MRSGSAYALPAVAGTAVSRQHDESTSKPAAVMARMESDVELGSSVPKDCHAPLACWLAAKKPSAACTAGSEASAPPATRASTATAVVSGSTSVPVGSPLKFQPPFACWAARMADSAAGGGVPHTSFFARTP